MKNILVTGGAGFIGANFVHYWTREYKHDQIVVLDALTYAGMQSSLDTFINKNKIVFVHGDICDAGLVRSIFEKYQFDTVVHFAAESHVDRSIAAPDAFVRTNILGTHVLLATAFGVWVDHFEGKRFHHISTDEVYGDLGPGDPAFTESTPYAPRSPYAASKASSDMLVRAYHTTYGLPITISNCSNNYGPYQFPEKLIPLMLINALEGKALPVYGDGSNVRDWLFVGDHCIAIAAVLNSGRVGETYNVGGENEIVNLELVRELCRQIDAKLNADDALAGRFPNSAPARGRESESLICFVKDRPGHDRRYAINPAKIATDLSFHPRVNFAKGLSITLDWYLNNEPWWRSILSGEHRDWIKQQYGDSYA
jgi:dTDP-glucose 4,6-dehydratase